MRPTHGDHGKRLFEDLFGWAKRRVKSEGLWYELERREYRVMRDRVPIPAGRPIRRTDRGRIFAALPRLAEQRYDRAMRRRGTTS